MPIYKNEYPILEYDTEKIGVIKPDRAGRAKIPERCLMTFFAEVLDDFVEKYNAEEINYFGSEFPRRRPIYKAEYKGTEIALINAAVGSASAAAVTDFLVGHGMTKLIVCGGCGVLTDIPAGDVILPVSALRDEGASYHYLPPSREITLDKSVISMIKETLGEFNTPYIEVKTWTTDAFYRETPDMITYRKEEGCQVVEMECAAIAAVAQFRDIKFGQLLYSGDILTDYKNYDERGWTKNITAREKLFYMSLESLIKIK